MKDIIINQPHLQSFKQKCGSLFIAGLSWCLWLYFLVPLFTLGGWLMGVKSLSDEIRWFGGYKTLLELLELYALIIVLIAALWLLWSLLLTLLHAHKAGPSPVSISNEQLASAFAVDSNTLQQTKAAQCVTVHFDSHANIVALHCDSVTPTPLAPSSD
jgi:biofilm PGA synthesis protein PgaD